ncbi:hypothetical protein SAMN05216559_0132 [Halomicrobium zhouii]|uniref:Uncharacterized protein n=1 Tax=Halomicrobium zhouii TaxID=767519 RepID=A0A1I6K3L2_9EURY|nr:hypothetical protein [Halomicrobium zhouii]SFR85754.1 hypothetical protein SAMN05216559_0132 [Halomicrobium zhouii]
MQRTPFAVGLYCTLGVGFSTLLDVLTGFNNFSGSAEFVVLTPAVTALMLSALLLLQERKANVEDTGDTTRREAPQ